MEANRNYLVVGSKSWNRQVFNQIINKYPGRWTFISEKKELSLEAVKKINPQYIFFLHWSWIVLDELVDNYECVCFHMTDVPYGRGGSPLQNLIVRGHRQTKLTALRMEHGLDTGPVYYKETLSLEGNAEEIYIRSSYLSTKLIEKIIHENPSPVQQEGEVVSFKRRKPAQSEIPELDSLQKLHDFIRMLDADGYPNAFIEFKGFRFEFSRANLYNGRIVADVKITQKDSDS